MKTAKVRVPTFKMHCIICKKETDHVYRWDKTKQHYQNIGGCRGVKNDYRTTQCLSCKRILEYDFSTD